MTQTCNRAGSEERGRGQQAKECGWLMGARKGKEMDYPLKPLEEMHSCQQLDFNPGRPYQTSTKL